MIAGQSAFAPCQTGAKWAGGVPQRSHGAAMGKGAHGTTILAPRLRNGHSKTTDGMQDNDICAAARTPIGRHKGRLIGQAKLRAVQGRHAPPANPALGFWRHLSRLPE